VTKTSATLIDNIFCNNIQETDLFKGILYTDISDHFPLFTITRMKYVSEKPAEIAVRQYTSHNLDLFKQKLETVNWESIISCNDCQ
jgi:hypothetical protein